MPFPNFDTNLLWESCTSYSVVGFTSFQKGGALFGLLLCPIRSFDLLAVFMLPSSINVVGMCIETECIYFPNSVSCCFAYCIILNVHLLRPVICLRHLKEIKTTNKNDK